VRTGDWPARLNSENFKQDWRIELGPSYSGPIVSDRLVFTTATEGKKTEVVTAVDRQSGKVAWRVEWDGAMKVPFFAARNGSWIRSTPAYDGESVFVAGMLDVLVSLDAKTGAENWRVDFIERFKSNRESFGFVCSPLVDGDAVYVQTGAGVVKLDKKTGETIWLAMKDQGGMNGGAFASPVRATLAGQDNLLVQSRSALSGISPKSGDVLWSETVKTFRGMNILTPLPHGDAVFTSAYGGRGHLFEVEEQEGKLVSARKWTNRVQAYMSTPVVIDGYAYVYLRSKRFCCVHLDSGELKWTSSSIADENWSMVAFGDRLLALSEAGELYLIAANTEEYEVLDVIEVAESETWAHLAVDGDQVLIRELDGLAAYTWK
jgi:outer membrane protein assembly factor BamB